MLFPREMTWSRKTNIWKIYEWTQYKCNYKIFPMESCGMWDDWTCLHLIFCYLVPVKLYILHNTLVNTQSACVFDQYHGTRQRNQVKVLRPYHHISFEDRVPTIFFYFVVWRRKWLFLDQVPFNSFLPYRQSCLFLSNSNLNSLNLKEGYHKSPRSLD